MGRKRTTSRPRATDYRPPRAAAPRAKPGVAAPPLSRRRRAAFVAITVALPWALIALLELALRLGGYGGSYPLFVPVADRPSYLVPNPDVGRRYFAGGPFTPTPLLDFFPVAKAPGTFRVVFQGESSAEGFPYGHGAAPSRIVQQELQRAFPDRRIEVVNAALTATNSYTMLDEADEIIAQHPDAVMIYAGHNEYYGAFGAGSARTVAGSRAVTRAYLALRGLRVVQLLGNAIASLRRTRGSAAPRTVMELMAGEQHIALGSARYRAGIDQFRANLAALLDRYHAHGITVLVGTIASNERDQPPFVSALAPGTDSAAWRASYREGMAALARGDGAAAVRALEATVRRDSAAAGLFALGRAHDAAGEPALAHDAYVAAKEHDELRFRAPEAIDRIIRREAPLHHAIVVESAAALERASPAGTVGHSLVLEHVHPNLDGYAIIAGAFVDTLRARALPGPWPPTAEVDPRRDAPVTTLDSLVGVLRTDRLTSGWPFQPEGSERRAIVDTLQPRGVTEQFAQSVVLDRMAWAEATDRLRVAYEGAGDDEQALRAARALAAEYSYSAQPLMDAARIAIHQRRYDAALGYVRGAVAREETANSVQLVGLLLLRLGNQPAAMPYLQRAAELAPGEQRMTVPLRAAATLPALEQAAAAAPRDTSALYDLALADALTQQYEKARAVLTTLRRIAPTNSQARALLARLPADSAAPPVRPTPR